jgi:hypothetical protein
MSHEPVEESGQRNGDKGIRFFCPHSSAFPSLRRTPEFEERRKVPQHRLSTGNYSSKQERAWEERWRNSKFQDCPERQRIRGSFALRSMQCRRGSGDRTGNSGEFRYVYLRKIRGHSRERSEFAAIRVEIIGRPAGFRPSNRELWRVPLRLPSQDLRPFAGAQRVCGSFALRSLQCRRGSGDRTGNSGEFRYIYLRKICGHSR